MKQGQGVGLDLEVIFDIIGVLGHVIGLKVCENGPL